MVHVYDGESIDEAKSGSVISTRILYMLLINQFLIDWRFRNYFMRKSLKPWSLYESAICMVGSYRIDFPKNFRWFKSYLRFCDILSQWTGIRLVKSLLIPHVVYMVIWNMMQRLFE